jgi:large subunit ribosomal protein L30
MRPAEAEARSMARIRITQTKSGIGHAKVMRRTLEALGLRGYQRSVEVEDSPQIRGMIHRVNHLVQVAPARRGEAG